MRNKYYVVIGLAIVAAAIILTISLTFFASNTNQIATQDNNGTQTAGAESINVKIGYIDLGLAVPLHVAQEKGIFEKYNIRAEPVLFRTGDSQVEALVAGQIDMYYGGSTTNLLAVEQRTPGSLKMFHVKSYSAEEPGTYLLVGKNSSFAEPKDLTGKKVAIFPSSTAKVLTEVYFDKVLGSNGSVVLVQASPLNWGQSLASGSVDAVLAYEPFAAYMISDGIAKPIEVEPWGEHVVSNIPTASSAFSTAFIKNNPEAAKTLVQVFDEANEYIKNNPDEARQIFLRHSKIVDEKTLPLLPIYPSWMQPNEEKIEKLQELADLLVSNKVYEKPIDVRNIIYDPADVP